MKLTGPEPTGTPEAVAEAEAAAAKAPKASTKGPAGPPGLVVPPCWGDLLLAVKPTEALPRPARPPRPPRARFRSVCRRVLWPRHREVSARAARAARRVQGRGGAARVSSWRRANGAA